MVPMKCEAGQKLFGSVLHELWLWELSCMNILSKYQWLKFSLGIPRWFYSAQNCEELGNVYELGVFQAYLDTKYEVKPPEHLEKSNNF